MVGQTLPLLSDFQVLFLSAFLNKNMYAISVNEYLNVHQFTE